MHNMFLKQFCFFFIFCVYSKLHLATSITIFPRLVFEDPSDFPQNASQKISDLREVGRYYRHPDSSLVSYPLVVEDPLGSVDKPLKIGVVGGGMAGIIAIYELSRISDKNNISVTLFEPDPEHFSKFVVGLASPKIPYKLRAGRVFSAVSRGIDSTQAAYELGAMRFPDTAGLTWHYANEVFNQSSTVDVFPNPGRVPTEFVHDEVVEWFQGKVWLNEGSVTKMLAQITSLGLYGNVNETEDDVSLFPIGGKDPLKVVKELKSKNTTTERLKEISREWKKFATTYDHYTLGSAVSDVIGKNIHKLPDVPTLQSNKTSAKINHYIELFGRFGFGTASIKPLFNLGLVDTFRESLWVGSELYYLPVRCNVELPLHLLKKATEQNGLKVTRKHARVCDVVHSDNATTGETSAVVVYYNVNESGEETLTPDLEHFDYVILATTPKKVHSMVRRVGFNNVEREVLLGDYQGQYREPLKVRPALVLSNLSSDDVSNAQIPLAISQVNMIPSSKIFATIKKEAYDKYAPKHALFNNEPIKAIISDSGFGTSFVIPSKVNPDYYSLLLSYAWSVETQGIQNELLKYPENIDEQIENGTDTKHRQMINAIINRTFRDVRDPVANNSNGEKPKYERWWLGKLLNATDKDGSLTDFISYDWTTHHTSGAFKRDLAGGYYNAHLLFRYHTHALRAKTLKNRFFLAGESYSQLGGWIEGAAMSAINAVCGLIVAANEGNVSKLNPEAQKVMTTLDPVA